MKWPKLITSALLHRLYPFTSFFLKFDTPYRTLYSLYLSFSLQCDRDMANIGFLINVTNTHTHTHTHIKQMFYSFDNTYFGRFFRFCPLHKLLLLPCMDFGEAFTNLELGDLVVYPIRSLQLFPKPVFILNLLF